MRVEVRPKPLIAARLGAPDWCEASPCGTPWAPAYRLQVLELGLEDVEARRYHFDPVEPIEPVEPLADARDGFGRPCCSGCRWPLGQPMPNPDCIQCEAGPVEGESASEVELEMAEVIAGAAAARGCLLRKPLASPEEVMLWRCPAHGWGPCVVSGTVMRRGCLERQLAALDAEVLAPGAGFDDGATTNDCLAMVSPQPHGE